MAQVFLKVEKLNEENIEYLKGIVYTGHRKAKAKLLPNGEAKTANASFINNKDSV